MNGIETLLAFIAENPVIIYGIIFLAMFVEGEAVILLSSVIAWQGYLRWDALTTTFILGAYVGNLLWYAAGRYAEGTRLGRWFKGKATRLTGLFDRVVLERYPSFAILSKFLYGTNHATLFLVGWNKYSLKKFLVINLYANVIWVCTILVTGWILGFAVDSIGFKKILHQMQFLVLAIFLGTLLIGKILRFFMPRHL